MKISELALATGISARMLRYYEQQGLIRPPRTRSGYREYGEREMWILDNLKLLQQAGLTLNVIRVLMPCIVSQPVRFAPCPLIVATLRKERGKIKKTIDELSQALSILEQYLKETEQFGVAPPPERIAGGGASVLQLTG